MFVVHLSKYFCSQVQNLSGGELQRVALALCLGKPADVYLIDEPRCNFRNQVFAMKLAMIMF